jgi:hypothetical protein
MLWEPRELLARVLLPLNPLEPPLNPLDRDELLGMSRLPILCPLELELRLLALGLRLVALAPVALGRDPPAPAPALRLPELKDCWVAPTRLPEADWLRVDPENLSAVDLFEYGAAPRWLES